ncbi:MAG: hypothetical protein J0L99_19025 [Chitinophagales bacterium]|nr:hypothetical protein [Chitinophagales bacterium]
MYTYRGSLYKHVVFAKNYKTGKVPSQKELEELAIHYASVCCNDPKAKKIDVVRFIREEFAQKDEIDEFSIASVFLKYENDTIKVKQYYKKQ